MFPRAVGQLAGVAQAEVRLGRDRDVEPGFEQQQLVNLAKDVDGNLVYLAPNRYNLQIVMEKWPTVGFHATREHGQRFE